MRVSKIQYLPQCFLLECAIISTVFGIGIKIAVPQLGNVIGTVENTQWNNNRSITTFRGIPYAEPPVGDLRFRPPVQISSWNGTLNATSNGPACPQIETEYISEDCLTLNVFVPEIGNAENETQLLPVLIFIHGGFFRHGSLSIYEPIRLMDYDDLIVVAPQFRLGFLGLFSLLNDDVPGNVQFLDQIMAMQWVQDNIEYFGGDKNRVTLYGHSSGAASIHFHLLSPLTEGLFHQTILQSGSALRTYGIDENPSESAIILANYCGCDNITDSEKIASCMRAIEMEEIVNCTNNYLTEMIYDGLTRARGHMAVVQKIGNQSFLTGNPKELMANGEFLKLPMMGGTARHDGSNNLKDIYDEILVPRGLVNDREYLRYNLTAYVLKYLGISDLTSAVLHTMMETHFRDVDIEDLVSMAPGLIDICSMVSYKSGLFETLRANKAFQKTYMYTFDYRVYDPNYENPKYPFDAGVSHGDDMRLLMPIADYQKENDNRMAELLTKLFTSFVINGVPTAEGVTWPVMSTAVGPYLVIDKSTSVKENFFDEFITSGGPSPVIGLTIINSWKHLIFIAFIIVCSKLYLSMAVVSPRE